jgi:aminodeoxyfutalosine synthase
MEMISDVEAQEILEGRDLIAIGVRGDEVRRRLHGARTTFVRVFEIHVEAPPPALPPRTSAGELRIVGQPQSADTAIGAVRAAAALADGVPVTGFSLADLLSFAGGSSLADTCRVLHDAGLEAIAEAPLDLLQDPAAAITAARGAGLAVTRLTVHSLDPGSRIAIVSRAHDVQKAIGGIRAFTPLPRTLSVTTPSTGYDDVKQIALARLAADNIPSIQVDWALYGPKLAQFALTIGADDVDNVSAVDPGILGTRRSPLEEIRGNIRSAGLEPVERNARFEAIG